MLNFKQFMFVMLASTPLIVLAFIHAHQLEELQKHPTYHCDGSATMGYAVPGTPEAAACWIEGGK